MSTTYWKCTCGFKVSHGPWATRNRDQHVRKHARLRREATIKANADFKKKMQEDNGKDRT